MYPIFNETDLLFIDKITYRFKSPERRDVVVSIDHTDERSNMPAVIIPDKCYFLLGDHRDLSRDSRTFGYV